MINVEEKRPKRVATIIQTQKSGAIDYGSAGRDAAIGYGLLPYFFDVLVRSGIECGLTRGVGEGDLAGVADGDGRIRLLFAKWALAGDGCDDVAEVTLGGGVELGFALVAANRDRFCVGAGDSWIRRLAGDGADGIQRFGGVGRACQQADSGEEGEDVFHG